MHGHELMGNFLAHHPIQWLEKELNMAAANNAQVIFDKSTYSQGDAVTGTVTWDSGEELQTLTVNVSISVSNQNNEVASVSGSFQVATEEGSDTFTVQASDDGNRTWDVQMSEDGKSATVTTVA